MIYITPREVDVLEHLSEEGRATTGMIAADVGTAREVIRRKMRSLEQDGHVRMVDDGLKLMEITDDGVEALREHHEEIERVRQLVDAD